MTWFDCVRNVAEKDFILRVAHRWWRVICCGKGIEIFDNCWPCLFERQNSRQPFHLTSLEEENISPFEQIVSPSERTLRCVKWLWQELSNGKTISAPFHWTNYKRNCASTKRGRVWCQKDLALYLNGMQLIVCFLFFLKKASLQTYFWV